MRRQSWFLIGLHPTIGRILRHLFRTTMMAISDSEILKKSKKLPKWWNYVISQNTPPDGVPRTSEATLGTILSSHLQFFFLSTLIFGQTNKETMLYYILCYIVHRDIFKLHMQHGKNICVGVFQTLDLMKKKSAKTTLWQSTVKRKDEERKKSQKHDLHTGGVLKCSPKCSKFKIRNSIYAHAAFFWPFFFYVFRYILSKLLANLTSEC